MIRRFLTATALSAVVLATSFGLTSRPVAAAGFDDAQKTEIQAIIRDYLLKNPEILEEAYVELENRRTKEQAESRAKTLSESGNILLNSSRQAEYGNPKGDVTVVEFFDYNCTYCRQAVTEVLELIKSDKNVRVVVKELPVLSDNSVAAAMVSIAVHRIAPEKHMEFHTKLFAVRGGIDKQKAIDVAIDLGISADQLSKAMNDPEVQATIDEVRALGTKLGINGTPTFIVGQELVPGLPRNGALKQMVADARRCGPDGKKC